MILYLLNINSNVFFSSNKSIATYVQMEKTECNDLPLIMDVMPFYWITIGR